MIFKISEWLEALRNSDGKDVRFVLSNKSRREPLGRSNRLALGDRSVGVDAADRNKCEVFFGVVFLYCLLDCLDL